MKINCICIALLLSLIGMACQNDKPVPANAAEIAAMPETTTGEATAQPMIGTSDQAVPTATVPPSGEALPLPTLQPAPTATTAKGGASDKLNPAHGQPGHRCEIPVGAPLDSKPVPKQNTAGNQIQVQPQPQSQSQPQYVVTPANSGASAPVTVPAPTAAPAPAKVAPGMNPAHGQPGHRCDISVGAPLNSKPAAKQ